MPDVMPGVQAPQPFTLPSFQFRTQQAPARNLTFPNIVPPAASSYGSTTPVNVPWTPPDLAGAINQGIKTGASLASDYWQNRKSQMEVLGEQQAQKIAQAQMGAPGAGERTGVTLGPQGAQATLLSPAELEIRKAQIAAEVARAKATYGETEPSRVAIEKEKAEIEKTKLESRRLGASAYDNAKKAGSTGEPVEGSGSGGSGDSTNPPKDKSGKVIDFRRGQDKGQSSTKLGYTTDLASGSQITTSPTNAQSTDVAQSQPQFNLPANADLASATGVTAPFSLASGATQPPSFPGAAATGAGTQIPAVSDEDLKSALASVTSVPSKGGLPVEEMSAKTGRGPIQQRATPKPTPKGTPAATPAGTPAPAQASGTPAPEVAQPPAPPETIDTKPNPVPPAFADPRRVAQVKANWKGDQDYRNISEEDVNDERFAGTDDGTPTFMDENGKFYIRRVTGPGREIRFYQNDFLNPNGVEFNDPIKAERIKEAGTKMQNLQQQIGVMDDYINNAKKTRELTTLQRGTMSGQENTGGWPWDVAAKTVGNIFGGQWWPRELGGNIDPEQRQLELKRQKASEAALQGAKILYPQVATGEAGNPPGRGQPTPPATFALPALSDTKEQALEKAQSIRDSLQAEFDRQHKLYPYANRQLEQVRDQPTQPIPVRKAEPQVRRAEPAAPRAQPVPGATPKPTPDVPTQEEISAARTVTTPEEYDAVPPGTLYRDSQGLKRKPKKPVSS